MFSRVDLILRSNGSVTTHTPFSLPIPNILCQNFRMRKRLTPILVVLLILLLIILSIAGVTIREIFLFIDSIPNTLWGWIKIFLQFCWNFLEVATFRVSWLDAPILPVGICIYLYGGSLASYYFVFKNLKVGWKNSTGLIDFIKKMNSYDIDHQTMWKGMYKSFGDNLTNMFFVFYSLLIFHCLYWIGFFLKNEKMPDNFWGFEKFL